MTYRWLTSLLLCAWATVAGAQGDSIPQSLMDWAVAYRPVGITPREKCSVESFVYDSARHHITVTMNDVFGSQQWKTTTPQLIYSQMRQALPTGLRTASMTVKTLGYPIEHLAPYAQLDTLPRLQTADYRGMPWVKNISQPYSFDYGLAGRHIALWASHGIYWNKKKKKWDWQRPLLNDVREDLLTPTIANELVIPMLEAAGAVVWTPRERCASTTEIIVDNDVSAPEHYIEANGRHQWQYGGAGFATLPVIAHGQNPFTAGSARMVSGTRRQDEASQITWLPVIAKAERLAVYVSYRTVPGSTAGAVYLVRHGGVDTYVTVNQTMGGSTWVYLGEYMFRPGKATDNCVVLTSVTQDGGIVTADAVRFGGGMGNIVRGGVVSGEPRYNEGARYSMQWAGMPDSIYSTYAGDDDYKDDINVRSMATNLLCGGSVYNPDCEGLRVPIELTIGIHTDAGVDKEGIVGSLGIATTRLCDGVLATGCSRLISRDLAEEVLTSVTNDMQRVTGRWNRRQLWDRNYSETRVPVVPSTIIEMLSHENPLDVYTIQDPSVRFHMARAIYKGILRFVYRMHALPNPIVQPLPVENLCVHGKTITWTPVNDLLEPTALATHYLVQVAADGRDYDNGRLVTTRSFTIDKSLGRVTAVRVSAVNAGGASLGRELIIESR